MATNLFGCLFSLLIGIGLLLVLPPFVTTIISVLFAILLVYGWKNRHLLDDDKGDSDES